MIYDILLTVPVGVAVCLLCYSRGYRDGYRGRW